MPIRKGEPWGRSVDRPDGLVTVTADADVAAWVAARRAGQATPPLFVAGGDLARTLGAGPPDRNPVNELPIDLVEVRLDGAEPAVPACAHVVMRTPWWRGGWFRGPIVLVMNAEFRGRWDVAPRGHPNDGRVEVVSADAELSVRQRFGAWRRLPSAAHVPHPAISTRSAKRDRWTFTRPVAVRVDGRAMGRATTVDIDVIADAGTVHA
jgi:hypothetical protein